MPETASDMEEKPHGQIPSSDDHSVAIYTAICTNLAREDSNTSNRIGWAIGLTSGQFAAISFMVTRVNDYSNGAGWPVAIAGTICAVSILGMYFCHRTRLGVDAAHEQIVDLKKVFQTNEDRFKKMGLPRPYGDHSNQSGIMSSRVFPYALLAFWSLIFVASLGGTIWTIARAAMAAPTTGASAADRPTPGPGPPFKK